MTMEMINNRVLTLAAMVQSVQLVQQCARHNQLDETRARVLLQSVLATQPESTQAVYGDLAPLRGGLQALQELLQGSKSAALQELTRYLVGLIAIERRLNKRPDLLQILAQRIERAGQQLQHYDLLHENMLASFAGMYSDTISTLPIRIQVHGNPQYLQDKQVQNRVRALLLAGLRATVLWRQNKGSRWELLWHRKRLLQRVQLLLRSA